MSGKHGWLDLVDLFYQPGTGSSRNNEPHSFAFVVLFILILVFGLFAVFNYEGGSDKSPRNIPTASDKPSARTKSGSGPRRFPVPDAEYCRVQRCVDGDTLIVLSKEGQERVRLIGSNTPETVRPNSPVEPFGPEATKFTRTRIKEVNNKVLLEADGDLTDKYGRRLALVWLDTQPPCLLNEELIRKGLARAEVQHNYSKTIKERFLAAQKQAQSDKLGVWSLPTSSATATPTRQPDRSGKNTEHWRNAKSETPQKPSRVPYGSP
ncbi:MAG: thermonuclease family protein [Thermoguttaceae bacterium]|nr:thermonuclease family protein [Thermoguttaceae bacterium]